MVNNVVLYIDDDYNKRYFRYARNTSAVNQTGTRELTEEEKSPKNDLGKIPGAVNAEDRPTIWVEGYEIPLSYNFKGMWQSGTRYNNESDNYVDIGKEIPDIVHVTDNSGITTAWRRRTISSTGNPLTNPANDSTNWTQVNGLYGRRVIYDGFGDETAIYPTPYVKLKYSGN